MKKGDKCYIIENNSRAQAVEIINYSGGFYTVKYVGGKTALRVRAERLFKTEESTGERIAYKTETDKTKYNGQLS